MKATEQVKGDGPFEARVGLGLRELDGVEQIPDVSADVVRRLEDHEPATGRTPVRWLAVAAAVLAIGVTTTLLVQEYGGRGAGDPAPAVSAQDPVGPWRLVYELPVDELQRSLRDNRDETLEQLLARSVESLQRRVGTRADVTRGDAATVTVTFANAAAGDVAGVRSLLENPGRLEMRAVASSDYLADGGAVRFEMTKEKKQLQAWLDGGGREKVQQDPRAIAEYHPANEHLRWFVHFVRPSTERVGSWDWRYADVPLLGDSVVAAHAAGDWNDGEIPAHIQARPVDERFLIEFVAVNMYERHFRETDLDPAKVAQTTDQAGRAAVSYQLRAEKAGDYADFSEQFLNKCCAVIWNDEVLIAPRFESRIPGVGRISGLSKAQAEAIAGILATPLPARLRLLRSEAGRPR